VKKEQIALNNTLVLQKDTSRGLPPSMWTVYGEKAVVFPQLPEAFLNERIHIMFILN